MQVAEPTNRQRSLVSQQLSPGGQLASSTAAFQVAEQAPLHLTQSPQLATQHAVALLSTSADGQPATALPEEQLPTALLTADASFNSQQLSPSLRRVQSRSLLAAAAALGTATPSSKPASEAGVAYPDTTTIFTSPAAQAARAYASLEPSPSHSSQLQSGSADSPAGMQSREMAASPISPQSATEAAVAEMRSTQTSATAADAKQAQTGGAGLPPVPIIQTELPPVQSMSVQVSSAAAAPASLSIPAAASVTTNVLQTVVQEPENAALPQVEPAATNRGLQPPVVPLQPTALPVTEPVVAPVLRPTGAFSYTGPNAAIPVPLSTDRYIPAIGYSPSRARVAREAPADAVLGHIRKQSFAGSNIDALPAVPQQAAVAAEETATTGYTLAAVPMPDAAASSDAPAGEGPSVAAGLVSAAMHGPAVTSMPLVLSPPASSACTAACDAAVRGLSTAVPSAIVLSQAAPSVVVPSADTTHAIVQTSGAVYGPGVTSRPLMQSASPATAFATSSLTSSIGVPVTPMLAEAAAATPDEISMNPAAVAVGLTPSSLSTTPGPLQEGQSALTPGPVAEGVESTSDDSASDCWSDADSGISHARTRQECTAAGPVCEGVESNSDVWSESASSEPGSPMSSAGQAVVGVPTQPAKQSRFGKLLSRAKGGSGPTAASLAAPAADAELSLETPTAEVQDAVTVSSAPAPTRTGMRSKLFGRARRQPPSNQAPLDLQADEANTGNESDYAVSSIDPPAASTFLENQIQGSGEQMAYQSTTWQAIHHEYSESHFQSDAATSSVSAAFATQSSAWFSHQQGLSTAWQHAPLQEQAAEEADLDPLSHHFEGRMTGSRQEGASVRQQRVALPQPVSVPQQGTVVISDNRLQARSPSPSDHGSFDPLTATLEEFEAFNRSHAHRLSPELPDLQQGQLQDQPDAVTQAQLQQQLPSAAGTSAQPRKTRSIPRIFKLRKTGPTAVTSSSPSEAAAQSTSGLQSAEANTPDAQSNAETADLTTAETSTEQAKAMPKPRSKPFRLLRKRSKATAKLLSSQSAPHTDEDLLEAATDVPVSSKPGTAQEPEQGLERDSSEAAANLPLADRDPEQVHHLHTSLGLSAGLSDTFGSFMAASPRASSRASPGSPHRLPVADNALEQASGHQVRACINSASLRNLTHSTSSSPALLFRSGAAQT